MFQVYDVRELQRQMRMKRAHAIGVFFAGALFGLFCSQPGGVVSSASAQAPRAQEVSCDGRTTFRLDCGLNR